MIVSYHNATLVTTHGTQRQPLVIDTRTGRILPPQNASKNQVDANGLYLYPGLINAHDHLELNHYPRTKPRDQYTNVRDWAVDMTALLQQEPFASLQRYSLADRCLIGGLKNLFSGVTTVAHHNPLHRLLKRRDFPVKVVQNYGWAHSLYLWDEKAIQQSYQKTRRGSWMIHLAEGTDSEAAAEFTQLEKLGCVSGKTLLIHGVALPDEAVEKCRGLIWCPSTNLFLLGQTAQVKTWYAAGKLALGSDSRLTADGDVLDELRAAHQSGQLSSQELFHLVTEYAAQLLHLDDVGELKPGMQADVIALPVSVDPDPYLALIKARRTDIKWVMRGGQILWEQSEQKANCTLDNVPYWLHPRIFKWAQKSQLQEVGWKSL